MEEKLAQYRAQKAKEYAAKKQLDGENVVKRGWQFFQSWGKQEVSLKVCH